MNPFFYAFLFFLLIASGGQAQLIYPISAEVWRQQDPRTITKRHGWSGTLDVIQPLGVSNLLMLDFQSIHQSERAAFTAGYRLIRMPGFARHFVAGRIQIQLSENFCVSQHLGGGVSVDGLTGDSEWLFCLSHRIDSKIGEQLSLQCSVYDWLRLIWTENPHLTTPVADLVIGQSFRQGLTGLFFIRATPAGPFIPGCALRYQWISGDDLFFSAVFNPPGFGLGYRLTRPGFSIGIFIQQGQFIGASPMAQFNWTY